MASERKKPSPAFESVLYKKWERYGLHVKEYLSEFAGTAFLMFSVVGIISFLFASDSLVPGAIPSQSLRLFLAGLFIGSASWLFALSPPGRLSGAHLNPAISIGFWVLRKMHARDLVGYIAAQMLGSVAGAFCGRSVFGRLANEVSSAALSPALNVTAEAAFLAEFTATFVLSIVIYTFVSHARLLRFTPAAATLMVAILVCADGNYTGAGMNPARWFGSALASGNWHLWWVYLFAPISGAILAALIRRSNLLGQPIPHTGKIFHDENYRSVFKHDKVQNQPPAFLPENKDN
ncbi:MAG TPA: aquaporin [Pyrinomonadaceae bacterium]|jgi:aquaporin Z